MMEVGLGGAGMDGVKEPITKSYCLSFSLTSGHRINQILRSSSYYEAIPFPCDKCKMAGTLKES